jgi:hypothetical protein
MKKIDTISSLEGRALLKEIFHELRYEKQLSSFATLALCWRICTYEREIFRYVKQEATILHPLGFFSGTALWMEEVINRYYFSTINSFVYFGAAVLLMLVGIRRFSNNVSDNVVIFGVAFEAMMLIFMFVVMLFTPNEENNGNGSGGPASDGTIEELITEVGEIGRDFAAVVVQLEELGETLQELIKNQRDLVESVNEVARLSAKAVSPAPEMLETMSQTNTSLQKFRDTVENLSSAAESLKREEIEIAVRKEVERFLVDKVAIRNDKYKTS